MSDPIDMATVQDVKTWLNLSVTTDDALLASLVTDASAYIQDSLSRDVIQKTYTNEVYHGNGTNRLVLRQYPIQSVTSIVVTDPSSKVQTTLTDFWFDDRTIYLGSGSFTQGAGNVKVTYVAGYTSIPQDMKRATIELTAFMYRSRTRIGSASKQLGGETGSFNTSDFPASVNRLIEQNQNVVPV